MAMAKGSRKVAPAPGLKGGVATAPKAKKSAPVKVGTKMPVKRTGQ